MLNVLICNTTAIPVCSFDKYFHVSAGQKPEPDKFSISSLKQVGVYSCLFYVLLKYL